MAFAPKRILVCTDFSGPSQAAADAAADLARLFGGTLTLVHVVPLSAYVNFAEELGQTASWSANVQETVSASAEATLQREAQRLARPGLEINCFKTDGPAQTEVARIADLERIDLVVCGSHGRTGLRHVLVGSVAEGIVRHCKCPVLVFHGSLGKEA